MVATSPIQYDDHSTVSSTPSANQQQQANSSLTASVLDTMQATGGPPMQRPEGAPQSPLDQQQQQRHHYQQAQSNSVQSPVAQSATDILTYQPPWKNLIDYAHHHQQQQQQQQQQSASGLATPPDRISTASPRYQLLIGQVSSILSRSSCALIVRGG